MHSEGNKSPDGRAVRARHTLEGNGHVRVESTDACLLPAGSPSHRARETGCGCRLTPQAAAPAPAPARPSASQQPIASIMTTQVLCVRADVSIDVVVELLLHRRISAVPVVNAAGEPIGVISKSDLVRDYYENDGVEVDVDPLTLPPTITYELQRGFRVKPIRTVTEAINGSCLTVRGDESVARAALLMAQAGIHRVIVVCDKGKVIGILSSLDVLRWLAEAEGAKTA
jgi:CBS-domain-containing membrane protein